MTKEQFTAFWQVRYSNTIPISHYFKNDYTDRWFRIHSLPESKRYPSNEEEWTILLTRQNQIITDLFGNESDVLLVTGDNSRDVPTTFSTQTEEVFKHYNFTQIDSIDLYQTSSNVYEEGTYYRPAFVETVWISHKHDNLLKEIANDHLRAFFISISKNVIVAPYDGGVDFLLRDEKQEISINKNTTTGSHQAKMVINY